MQKVLMNQATKQAKAVIRNQARMYAGEVACNYVKVSKYYQSATQNHTKNFKEPVKIVCKKGSMEIENKP